MHAQEEARRLKHAHVGCEHILLGLCAIGEGSAYRFLSAYSFDLESLRMAVEKIHKKGRKASPKELPFDADAKTSLERAFRVAITAHERKIQPEHLLSGLFHLPFDSDNAASKVLQEVCIDRQEVRQALMASLNLMRAAPEGPDVPCMSQDTAKWFLKQCSQVSMFAIAEAMRMKQGRITSDMLLLGLLGAGGTCIRVLEDFGITLEPTREIIESQLGEEAAQVMVDLPVSPCAMRLLRAAGDEATALGHDTLKARHILLGFTHEQEGIAWQIFKEKNVDIEALRAAVLALFEDKP